MKAHKVPKSQSSFIPTTLFPTNQITFLPTKVGKQTEFRIKLRNSYDYPIVFYIKSSNMHFQITPESMLIDAHKKSTLTVIFKPKAVGTWNGQIKIKQNNKPDKINFFTVLGQGTN